MNRAVVKLDALTDTNRAGTEDDNLFTAGILSCNKLSRFVFIVIGGVEVRSFCLELSRTGINHLVACIPYCGQFLTGEPGNGGIQIAHLLGADIFFQRQFAVFQFSIHPDEVHQLVEEPFVDHGYLMDMFNRESSLEAFIDSIDSLVIRLMDLCFDLFIGIFFKFRQGQRFQTQFDTSDSLHDTLFKGSTDCHDLTGSLHLGTEGTFCIDKLVKRPLGEFDDQVVQCRLKAGIGCTGNGVDNLVHRITDSDLGCNLCNRVTGCLGSQRGRTGNTGVYLDNRILHRFRMECKLAVASAFDFQLRNDVQSSGTQHLVFFICQCNSRSNDNRVTGMDTNRVEVFHRADGDDIVLSVTDDLELDFLPAGDTLFNQNLGNRGETQTVCCDIPQLSFVLSDTAAGTTQRKCRTNDNRVVDNFCKIDRILNCCYDLGRNDRLIDCFHRILKALSVLCFVDSFGVSTQQLDAVLIQKSALGQFHRKGQTGLSTEGRQQRVGFFNLNDAFADIQCQRLNVDLISHRLIGHDGCGVGVEQDDLKAFFLEGTAGLSSCVVKFSSLTDNDRAGANNHDLLYIFSQWHKKISILSGCGKA